MDICNIHDHLLILKSNIHYYIRELDKTMINKNVNSATAPLNLFELFYAYSMKTMVEVLKML
jgi:hypothetical protein